MIQTLTFGYLPKKWKRLIRTPFIFWLCFLFSAIISRNGHWGISIDDELLLIVLLPSLAIFFAISYILKPFIIKDED